jgi:hypothetical protein
MAGVEDRALVDATVFGPLVVGPPHALTELLRPVYLALAE